MQKILITGGSGYLGSKLVAELQKKGYEVEVFDEPKDIQLLEELEEAIKGKDVVYHLAALAQIDYTDEHPDETFNVNVIGTNNVCEICAENNVLLNFISTSCIYGEPLEIPSREDSLINPTDTYAMSKAAGEYIVKMWGLAKGLRYNIIRTGTSYGPSTDKGMRTDMCIQKFLLDSRKGEPLVIYGDGKQTRNFIHLNDLIRGFIAITEKGIEGETINLAGKEIISVDDIANFAIKLGVSNQIIYKPERKDDFRNQNIYLGKAFKLLNWQPEVRFAEGIEEFYNWLK